MTKPKAPHAIILALVAAALLLAGAFLTQEPNTLWRQKKEFIREIDPDAGKMLDKAEEGLTEKP